jgi:hypothetical protein
MMPTGTITGLVLAGGQPVAGLAIQADALQPVQSRPRGPMQVDDIYSATSDANGRFLFSLVEAGCRVRLSTFSEKYMGTQPNDHVVQVAAGQTLETPPWVMMRLDKPVSGIVVDPDGKPVAGATVSAQLRSDESIPRAFTKRPTGPDGKFTIQGVPNVPLMLMAYMWRPYDPKDAQIRFPVYVDAEPGETDVRIVLDPKLVREKK